MMQALLIGQNFQLQRVWAEVHWSTGTFHVIVISGTHVAILAAFFLFLLRVCFVPESVALPTTVLACWLYALVTGFQAPGVRSGAGLTLFMICGYLFRRRHALNLLAAVALGFLALDPEQLFVDDNSVNQLVAQRAVDRFGYTAEVVSGGAEALAAIREAARQRAPFDAVLMDCQMPDMDGYETTAAIRQWENGRRRVPIIALTAQVRRR